MRSEISSHAMAVYLSTLRWTSQFGVCNFPSQAKYPSTRCVPPPAYHLADQIDQPLGLHHHTSTSTVLPLPSLWRRPILRSRHPACPERALSPNRLGNKPLSSASSTKLLLQQQRQTLRQIRNASKRESCR